jgi:hypothetical protein
MTRLNLNVKRDCKCMSLKMALMHRITKESRKKMQSKKLISSPGCKMKSLIQMRTGSGVAALEICPLLLILLVKREGVILGALAVSILEREEMRGEAALEACLQEEIAAEEVAQTEAEGAVVVVEEEDLAVVPEVEAEAINYSIDYYNKDYNVLFKIN